MNPCFYPWDVSRCVRLRVPTKTHKAWRGQPPSLAGFRVRDPMCKVRTSDCFFDPERHLSWVQVVAGLFDVLPGLGRDCGGVEHLNLTDVAYMAQAPPILTPLLGAGLREGAAHTDGGREASPLVHGAYSRYLHQLACPRKPRVRSSPLGPMATKPSSSSPAMTAAAYAAASPTLVPGTMSMLSEHMTVPSASLV